MKGRPLNSTTINVFKWHIEKIDLNTFEVIEDLGKFCSIQEFNRLYGTNVTPDHIWKLKKLKQEDFTEKRINKKNSFLAKYGCYKFNKINEPIEFIKIRKN